MAECTGREAGREATGSQTGDAGDASLARGAAGAQTGAKISSGTEISEREERRETEQVLRPTSDGVGEGLPKDQS